MKILIVALAALSIVNGQDVKVDAESNANGTSSGSGATGSGEVSVGGSYEQSQGQGGYGHGSGGSSWGDIAKGVADGIGGVIQDFEKPTHDIGQHLCLLLTQGFGQIIRWNDYIGRTYTISIDGKPVANGTVTNNGPSGTGTQSEKQRHADHRILYKPKGDPYGGKGDPYGGKEDPYGGKGGSYGGKGGKGCKKHGVRHANGEVH